MRIGINVTYGALKHPTGVGNYIINLVTNLLRLDRNNKYFFYYRFNKVNRENFFQYQQVKNKFFEPRLSFLNIFDKLDIFHDPSFKYVNFPFAKIVTTIHDVVIAVDEDFTSSHSKKVNLPKLEKALFKSDKLIAVSEFSKKEIIKYFNVSADKIKVIYSGVDKDRFQNYNENNKLSLPDKYFLYVGNIENRKNIKRIVKAFDIFSKKYQDYYLILIGKNGYNGEEIREFIKNIHNPNIIEIEYVENKELPVYYKNSIAFLFPSLYEGFGLPILEAFASGTIVITSNNSATVEAGGDAALYVNPYNMDDIILKMEKVVKGGLELRESLLEKARKHLENFSWEKTAINTLALYKSLQKE